MTKYILAAVAALALTGCGGMGGGKGAMVKACVDSGETEANCTCIADSLEKNLDKETFALVSNAMAAGEEQGNKMMEELPADKQGAVMGALMSAGMGCMMGSTEG
jgi:hypothetical protein